MSRRVVVTGLGALTPIGNDVASYWDGLKNGRNGIAPVTRFDTADLKAKLAAEVKDFDPKQYLDAKTVRQTDRYQQYALAAVMQAVSDSGIKGQIEPERFGVYYGSGIGGFETFVNEHNTFLNRGPSRVSPFFITFDHSSPYSTPMTVSPSFRLISDSASVEGSWRSLMPTWHLTVPR